MCAAIIVHALVFRRRPCFPTKPYGTEHGGVCFNTNALKTDAAAHLKLLLLARHVAEVPHADQVGAERPGGDPGGGVVGGEHDCVRPDLVHSAVLLLCLTE